MTPRSWPISCTASPGPSCWSATPTAAAVSCLRSPDLQLTAADQDELLATAEESLDLRPPAVGPEWAGRPPPRAAPGGGRPARHGTGHRAPDRQSAAGRPG